MHANGCLKGRADAHRNAFSAKPSRARKERATQLTPVEPCGLSAAVRFAIFGRHERATQVHE